MLLAVVVVWEPNLQKNFRETSVLMDPDKANLLTRNFLFLDLLLVGIPVVNLLLMDCVVIEQHRGERHVD